MPRFTVCIDWVDDKSPLSSDVDEVKVLSSDEKSAIEKAKARWQDTFGRRWPSCRIVAAAVLAESMRDQG